MELKDIQSLIKLISNSTVDEVSVEKSDFKIKIKKNAPNFIQGTAMAAPEPVFVQQSERLFYATSGSLQT